MQWQEVREKFPDRYAVIEIIKSHRDGNRLIVDDFTLLDTLTDPKEATRRLVRSKDNQLVYHTGNEKIEVRIMRMRPYVKKNLDVLGNEKEC